MTGHIYRKGYDVDPFAEWVRQQLPSAGDGIVRADLDTAFRRYGPNYGLGHLGDLMLVEQKTGKESVTRGQRHLYEWIDQAIRGGKMAARWRGCHLLRIRYRSYPELCAQCGRPRETADEAYARFLGAALEVDGRSVTHEELWAWLLGIGDGEG